MNRLKEKIRTVKVGKRGQLVIPEDIREDWGIEDATTLVLIERIGEIVLKKESEVLKTLESEDKFWETLSKTSMEKSWDKEDEVWDKIYKKRV